MTKRSLILTSAAAATVAAFAATPAQAVTLGVQDDGLLARDPATVYHAGHAIGARWTRLVVSAGDMTAAAKIRTAHANGFRVILTVGGTATKTPHLGSKTFRKYIARLPKADRYVWLNEPDLINIKPCYYRRAWTSIRRHVPGLLWGDFSPHAPLTFTVMAWKCKHQRKLPTLPFAVHPYQWNTDPLSPGADEGSIGSLGRLRSALRRMHIRSRFWLDEFGYPTRTNDWGALPPTPEQIAWMWPRAIKQATRVGAQVLMVYQLAPSGPTVTWDTHVLGTPAWCVLSRACVASPQAVPADTVDAPFTGA